MQPLRMLVPQKALGSAMSHYNIIATSMQNLTGRKDFTGDGRGRLLPMAISRYSTVREA